MWTGGGGVPSHQEVCVPQLLEVCLDPLDPGHCTIGWPWAEHHLKLDTVGANVGRLTVRPAQLYTRAGLQICGSER